MRNRLALLGALLLMFSAPASADSFVLHPPSFLDFDHEGNRFGFYGEGFSAEQDFPSTLGISFGVVPGCDPCSVGQAYTPNFNVTNTFMGTGPASVGGSTFSDVSFYGDLSFETEPHVFAATSADFVGLMSPFTFTGTLRGFQGGELAFSVDLSGAGHATRGFDQQDGLFYAGTNRLTYVFAEPAAPTPEPASLLLLATGVAGLAARKRLTRA